MTSRQPKLHAFRRRTRLLRVLASLAIAIGAATVLARCDARSRGLLANTFALAGESLLISLPIGTFTGVVLARTDVWGRRVLIVLLAGLLFVPLYLQAAAWQAGFGIEGWQTKLQADHLNLPWLDRWRGAVWVHGCAGIAWVALFVGVASRQIPRDLEEQALLDLTALETFLRVTLRLLFPAVLLSAAWVAITSMVDMTVTDLFAVRTYAEELYIELNVGSWNALMGVSLEDEGPVPTPVGIVVMSLAVLGSLYLALAATAAASKDSRGSIHIFELGAKRAPVSAVVWLVVGVFVLLPLGNLIYQAGSLVIQSDEGYVRGWSLRKAAQVTLASPTDHAAEFGWSLLIAVATAAATLLMAIPLAYAARRNRLAAGLAIFLAVAGLALPGPLIGLGLISLFNDPALPWLNELYDRTIAVIVIAHVIRAFPISFFVLWTAIGTISQSLFEQMIVSGAGPLMRIWTTVRQRPAAPVLAALAAFVVSLGELGATILVTPPGMEPLSVRIFGLLHYNVEDQVAGITLVLVAAFAAASWLLVAGGARMAAGRKNAEI